MSKKSMFIAAYLGIGVLFAIYGAFWGVNAHRSFMFNVGQGLVWPAILFPSLGKAVGGALLVAVILGVVAIGKNRR
jgi:hypothetical protein